MTPKQAKLIILGMNIQRRERLSDKKWISEFQGAFYEKERIKAEQEYFDLWFEMYRERLEDKYLECIEDKEVGQEMLIWNNKFIEWCREQCFKNL